MSWSTFNWAEWLLLAVLAFGLFVHLSGFFVSTWFARKLKPPPLPEGKLPGVTVIKTCVGVDDGEEELFDALFHQDYPGPLQLIFTVPNTECAANPVIDAYLKKYPQVDAMKLVSTTRLAAYRKVDAVYDAHPHVKHELVAWSDSDVVMTPRFVRDVAASLLEPGVSMVSTPQLDVGVDNFATALKTLGNNVDNAVMVPWYLLTYKPVRMVVGHLIAFHKKDLDELADELWKTLRVALADDQGMGLTFAKHGKKIVFRNIDNPVRFAGKTMKAMVSQKERHAICQQAGTGSKWVYLAFMFTYAQLTATVWWLTHLNQPWSWAVLATPAVIRILLSLWVEKLFLGTVKMTAKWFWTIPIWDLIAVYFILKATWTQRIDYHGVWYDIVDRIYVRREAPPEHPPEPSRPHA
ncbi:MAG: hypothetical protein AMXMBFR34_38760 [Myxococcaceae bacterium]